MPCGSEVRSCEAKLVRRRIRAVLGTAVLFLLARPAAGHDTWILARQSDAQPGQAISFDLTSGMAFPGNETAVAPDRLARASARLGDTDVDLARDASEKSALRLTAQFSRAGIATVWIESKPRSLELTPEEVREYLEEI